MSDLSGAAEGCVGLQGRRSVWVPSDCRFVRSRWFVNRAKVLCLLSLAGTWIWESRDDVQDEAACAGETEKVHNVIKLCLRGPNCSQVASRLWKEAPTRPCTSRPAVGGKFATG
jgi:hypothetical protein